jgi:CAS/CSE protein, C-terminus
VPQFLDKVADFLRSQSFVNQSYAAACIEKLLLRRTTSPDAQGHTGAPIFSPGNVDLNLLQKLLQGLCELLSQSKNLYAVRSLYRTVQLAQDNILPFAETLGGVLQQFIDGAARDESQSSPNYMYILFETAALTLRHVKQNPEVFAQVEGYLGSALNFIIEKNIQDMIGYAFQLYALFVANSQSLNPNYKVITDSLLANTANWDKDMRYMIPALSQFLIAMVYKYP